MEFGQGKFDKWCVHTTRPNGTKWYAKDYEYLYWIQKLGKDYGKDNVYTDFLRVYDVSVFDYDDSIAYNVIQEVDKHYHKPTEQWWSLFYKTMVAEERKENTILGKRIKRLGVYNVLFDNYSAKYTARYMRGMDWQDLDDLMYQRGI